MYSWIRRLVEVAAEQTLVSPPTLHAIAFLAVTLGVITVSAANPRRNEERLGFACRPWMPRIRVKFAVVGDVFWGKRPPTFCGTLSVFNIFTSTQKRSPGCSSIVSSELRDSLIASLRGRLGSPWPRHTRNAVFCQIGCQKYCLICLPM
uniref:Secreted protein n=1 Tax=Steinernema glaseri TaxID=37863 RepID=A0A1I7Y6Z0_9BILA